MPLKVRKNRSQPLPPICPLSECMKLLGGAWTPNVVWHLSGGARRFGELRADIPAVSAKVLTERLRPAAYVACTVEIDEAYDQTPGPGAGARLGGAR